LLKVAMQAVCRTSAGLCTEGKLLAAGVCRLRRLSRLDVDARRRLVLAAAPVGAALIHARIDQHGHLLLATIIAATIGPASLLHRLGRD
jgi:hypothetical protein